MRIGRGVSLPGLSTSLHQEPSFSRMSFNTRLWRTPITTSGFQLPRYIRKDTRVLSELSLIAITTRRKPVIGTELGVGQNKGLKAMGATMRYLSH